MDNGTLLMIGRFAAPQQEGAMGIFTTREAAEEFVVGDPFVLNGLVRRWHVRKWNETLWKPECKRCTPQERQSATPHGAGPPTLAFVHPGTLP